jgi:hypothetical protein
LWRVIRRSFRALRVINRGPRTTNRRVGCRAIQQSCVKGGSWAAIRSIIKIGKTLKCSALCGEATSDRLLIIENSGHLIARGENEALMKEAKQEAPSAGPGEPTADGTKKAEKIRSSRYEWEGTSGEPEGPPAVPRAARGSFRAALSAWLKKVFSFDFFDKDDDPTPSAA